MFDSSLTQGTVVFITFDAIGWLCFVCFVAIPCGLHLFFLPKRPAFLANAIRDSSVSNPCYLTSQIVLFTYERRSICNENSPVYPKALYLHTS